MLPLVLLVAFAASAQPQRPPGSNEPLPKGQRIEAKDGDIVVIRGDARVRIVHRSEGNVRAIYNSAQRWLVLLIDYADPKKGGPDGTVDSSRTFQDLDGVWPLGERWEGSAALDDYSMANTPGGSLGITMDGAFVQLFSGSPATNTRLFADERAVALRYNGGNSANAFPGGPRQTFDEIETRVVADAARYASNHGAGSSTSPFEGPGGSRFTYSVGMTVPKGGGVTTSQPPPSQAPVRVGGNIPQPRKVTDALPLMPPDAQQAGIHGVVILEIVIGADGAVTDAKVLRSLLPSMDRAAVDAVRQWRYEPTQLNGQAVPVIMTATVSFP